MSELPLELEQQLCEHANVWTSDKILDALHDMYAPGQAFTINDALIAMYKVWGTVLPRKHMNNHLGRMVKRGQIDRVQPGVYTHA